MQTTPPKNKLPYLVKRCGQVFINATICNPSLIQEGRIRAKIKIIKVK